MICSHCCVCVQVCWHRLNIGVLAALHDLATAGKGASLDLWQWKALAQLHDLYIHHAEGSKPFKAANALLTGEAFLIFALTVC